MARWTLEKRERKVHVDGDETVTLEATVHLEDPVTLGDVAQLVQNLNTTDGIPWDAVLGITLDVPLRWLPPAPPAEEPPA